MKSITLNCASIQVAKGRLQAKQYLGEEAVASVDSKCIFVGPTGNWPIKSKDLLDLQINDEEILLKTERLTVVLHQYEDATTIDQHTWENFASKVQAIYEKSQSKKQFSNFIETSGGNKRKASTFTKQADMSGGKAKTVQTTCRPRAAYGKNSSHTVGASRAWKKMPWDDNLDEDGNNDNKNDSDSEDNESTKSNAKKKTPQERFPAKLVSALKKENFSSSDEDGREADESDVSLASEPEEKAQKVKKRRRKRISKLRDRLTSDTDDDDDIFDTTDLTTPAAQHVVSPGGRTTDRITEPPVELLSPKEDASQKKVSSYFQLRKPEHRTSFQPRNIKSTPPPPKTPPRPTPLNTVPARLVHAGTTAATKRKQRLRPDGFLPSSAPARGLSPAQKMYRYMVGDSNMYNKTAEEEDPIQDSPSPPPRKRMFKRNRLNYSRRSSYTEHKVPMLELNRAVLDRKSPIRRNLSSPLGDLSDNANETPGIRFRGLRNLGNTCYLNASLQMLYTCQKMITSVGQFPGGRLTKSVVEIGQELRQRSSPTNFLPAVNPRIVKEAMDEKTDKFAGYEQRDAHEFLNDLIDYMHEELEENCSDDEEKKKTLPTNAFCLHVQVCLKCNSCGYTRNKEEMYRHLSIDIVRDKQQPSSESASSPVLSKASVEKSLSSFFKPEVREIKCEKCADGTEASQTLRIISRPKVLLLHLKRFIVVEKPIVDLLKDNENQTPNSPARPVPVEYVFKKNKAAVSLPPTLTLDPFRIEEESESTAKDSSKEYSLKSIVHHIGMRASSGHYTADAVRQVEKVEKPTDETKSDDQVAAAEKQAIEDDKKTEEAWVQFDDGITSLTKFDSIVNSLKKQQTAYMLLYTLNDSPPEMQSSTEQLEAVKSDAI